MDTIQTKRLPSKNRRLRSLALLLVCSSTIWGQTTYFSTKTGLISGSPLPDDQWNAIAEDRWQVNPYHRQTIIGTDRAGNYSLSVDSGSTFTVITNPLGAAKDIRFHFDAADPNLLFAQSGSDVSASEDRGAHWNALVLPGDLPGPEAGSLLFSDLNTGSPRLFVARGQQTWEGPYNSGSPVWSRSLSAESAFTVLATNDEQSMVVAGARNGSVHIRRSFDESGAWFTAMIRPGSVSAIAFDPMDDKRLAVSFSDSPGTPAEGLVYVSFNAGLGFTPLIGLPDTAVRQIVFVADNQNRVRLYAVASRVFVSTDFVNWYREAGLDNQIVKELQQVDSAGALSLVAESGHRMYQATLPDGGCASSVTPQAVEAPSSGGKVVLQVDANPSGCAALPQSLSQYPVLVADVRSGNGNGAVILAVDPNSAAEGRNLYVNIGHERVLIHQSGRALAFSANVASCGIMKVSPSHVGKNGGKVAITVRKTSSCGDIVVGSPESWIENNSPDLVKNGTATVTITVAGNPGTARSGSVSFEASPGRVAGAPVKITQDAGSTCNGATASITQSDFESAGGAATITMKPSGVCPSLKAKPSASWITVRKTATNEFSVRIAPNASHDDHHGVITISDPTHPELAKFEISEGSVGGGNSAGEGQGSPSPGPGSSGTGGACTGIKASLSPSAFPIEGGSAILTVTPAGACKYEYTIRPSVAWITLRQTSPNRYAVSIASNSGNPGRSATLQVNTFPDAFTVEAGVTQAGLQKCTAIAATLSQTSFPATGGSATLNVQSTGDCPNPVVTSSSPWITIGSSATNAFPFQIAANPAPESRSGSLKLAAGSGIATTVTLKQFGQCAYTVSPTSLSYQWKGGVLNVTVKANVPTCNWTTGPILSNFGSTTWVHLNRTQGTDSGTIQVAVDSDADSVQGRAATVEVAGVQVSINQGISGCTCVGPACGANMQLGIDRNSFGPSGGQAKLTLLAPKGCSWTLSSDVGWIQFPNGTGGIGNGLVLLNILPNDQDVASRVGYITSPQATPDAEGRTAKVTITEQGNN